jgi:hypothetical protein
VLLHFVVPAAAAMSERACQLEFILLSVRPNRACDPRMHASTKVDNQ